MLEYELACARGVHPSAVHLPGSTPGASGRSGSVDHGVGAPPPMSAPARCPDLHGGGGSA